MRTRRSAPSLFRLDVHPGAPTRSLPEQIAERLGNAIINEELAPGEPIREVALASEFKVSRAPVREALRILERDGLVKLNARTGAQVTRLSLAEVNEIYEIRAAMMSLAVPSLCRNLTPERLRMLERDVGRLTRLAKGRGSAKQYVATSYTLSLKLADWSGNKRLLQIVNLLARQTARYTRLGLSTAERRRQSATNWRRMLEAFRDGDEPGAAAIIAGQVQDTRRTVMKILEREQAQQETDE